jgi:hypothetical protein
MVSWRNQLKPYYPRKDQENADDPAEIHGLFKEQDTKDSSADNPYSGPDCIGSPYWQSFQGSREEIKANDHAGDRKDAWIKPRETFRIFQPYCPGNFTKTSDEKIDPFHFVPHNLLM